MPDVLLWNLEEAARQLGGISPRTGHRPEPRRREPQRHHRTYANAYRLGQHVPRPARLAIQLI